MTRAYRNRAQWQSLIEQFESSELNITDFCRNHKISQGSFYQKRKQLREQGKSPESHPLFVDITAPLSSESTVPQAWDIELELGLGVVLRMRRPC